MGELRGAARGRPRRQTAARGALWSGDIGWKRVLVAHSNRCGMTRLIRNQRGQATVEFALILPLLLLLVLGVIEFGKAWNLAQMATDAVREGTRQCVLADNTKYTQDNI